MVTLSSLRQLVETQQGTTGLDSAQVSEIAGAGLAVYETLDSLPSTGLTAGDEAFVKSNSRLYVSNGSGWYNTTLVNRTPRWDSGGEPDATYTIADSATPLIVTARAIDSDNAVLINQSTVSDSAQYMVDISNDSSVWTFTPKTAAQIGASVAAGNLTDSNGDFIYTFKWSDGVSVLSKPVTISYSPGVAPEGFTVGGGLTEDLLPHTGSAVTTGQALRSFTSSVTGTTFYWSGGLSDIVGTSTNYGSMVTLNTNPGGTFYIAMIGGGGGAGYRNKPGGHGGVGVAQITVPPGATTMTIFAGGGGLGSPSFGQSGQAVGGIFGGGDGGPTSTGGGSYSFSQSGGGLTGIFYNSTFTASYHTNWPYQGSKTAVGTAVAVVGGGGGAGADNTDYGGGGGGLNQDAARGRSNGNYNAWGDGAAIGAGYSNPTNNGLGERATTTTYGRAATRVNSYHGTPDDGEQYHGGQGSDSQYDAGGGGGGGYYGGGGGGGGGGYSGGTGGGGSGYINSNYATIAQGDLGSGTVDLTMTGDASNSSAHNTTIFTSYVAAASGATDFTLANINSGGTNLNSEHGRGEIYHNYRNHGQFVLWSS